jgi:hypothetical protein
LVAQAQYICLGGRNTSRNPQSWAVLPRPLAIQISVSLRILDGPTSHLRIHQKILLTTNNIGVNNINKANAHHRRSHRRITIPRQPVSIVSARPKTLATSSSNHHRPSIATHRHQTNTCRINRPNPRTIPSTTSPTSRVQAKVDQQEPLSPSNCKPSALPLRPLSTILWVRHRLCWANKIHAPRPHRPAATPRSLSVSPHYNTRRWPEVSHRTATLDSSKCHNAILATSTYTNKTLA